MELWLAAENTRQNQTGRSGGCTLPGGSGRRSEAAKSSRRVAEAYVLHESQGSLERQFDSQINREEIHSES
eukprot:7095178-Pyramimonas_sp.AAC.1